MIKPYLEAAKVVSTHGVLGEVRAQSYCDDPEILCHLSMLYLDPQGKHPVGLQRGRVHKNVVILKLDGVNSLEDAQKLRARCCIWTAGIWNWNRGNILSRTCWAAP